MSAEIVLNGIDGCNPLAYLAALGALRSAGLIWPELCVRLGWRKRAQWVAVLAVNRDSFTADTLLDGLHARLAGQHTQAYFTFQPAFPEPQYSLKRMPAQNYRRLALRAIQPDESQELRDFAGAWGCELKPRRAKADVATPTAFDFTAGQQGLLDMVRATIQTTTREQLRACLFNSWVYDDRELSLRWDLLDEARRYALQASDPAGSRNPIRTMRGANRLAIEALPLFPVIPGTGGARTTAFSDLDRQVFFTWPIWTELVDGDVVKSILAQQALIGEFIDRKVLAAMGIADVLRSRVVKPAGYYRSFAPPRSVPSAGVS